MWLWQQVLLASCKCWVGGRGAAHRSKSTCHGPSRRLHQPRSHGPYTKTYLPSCPHNTSDCCSCCKRRSKIWCLTVVPTVKMILPSLWVLWGFTLICMLQIRYRYFISLNLTGITFLVNCIEVKFHGPPSYFALYLWSFCLSLFFTLVNWLVLPAPH